MPEFNRKNRDRCGGHMPTHVVGEDGIVGWTNEQRLFVKKLTKKKIRRQHKKATQQAIAEYDNELIINDYLNLLDDYGSMDYYYSFFLQEEEERRLDALYADEIHHAMQDALDDDYYDIYYGDAYYEQD